MLGSIVTSATVARAPLCDTDFSCQSAQFLDFVLDVVIRHTGHSVSGHNVLLTQDPLAKILGVVFTSMQENQLIKRIYHRLVVLDPHGIRVIFGIHQR